MLVAVVMEIIMVIVYATFAVLAAIFAGVAGLFSKLFGELGASPGWAVFLGIAAAVGLTALIFAAGG